ncbi:MAG TPA: gephyrin-like molybdotransferase Glp [Acidimicrobiales bacterium]|nr:gephyrin-like molybdotransferase Glp [Acidimicrobiales bacterium]
MIPADEARALVLASCARLHPKALPLVDVLGCATSVPLDAPEDVPPFANTAMDGYAVRAADTAGAGPDSPVRLDVAGLLPAGAAPTIEVRPGSAVRIMTGAAMPPGADAVVMVEETESPGDGTVLIHAEVSVGVAVRAAGSDMPKGARVFEPQTVIQPAHLGVLASLGYVRVPVFPRARVGVISTGDELVEGGGPLAPGQIRESNREMLLALVEQANCTPVDLGLVRDDKDEISEVFERGAAECDALISSGGVSMGDFDLVKVVLDEIGDMRWMQIAIKPAKPFAFGLVGASRTPVFGLPGNPVSSLVSFELFARPALRQMMGHADIDRPRLLAVTDVDLTRQPDGKTHHLRVTGRFEADGRYHVVPVGAQGSHQLAATASATALVAVPDGDGVPRGADVRALLLI